MHTCELNTRDAPATQGTSTLATGAARACALAAVLALCAAAGLTGRVPWARAAPPAHARTPRHAAATAPHRTTVAGAPLDASQRYYLTLAKAGVQQAERRWRDAPLHWYAARLDDPERYPLATIWDIVSLFEGIDAIAIAQPTAANRRAVVSFAAGAERYLNRGLRPLPGYSPYPDDREANTETWFDDNGWWGLAFVEAYRATGSRRYLSDAARALAYIAAAGWDPEGGGIWWNTDHPFKSGPALASDTLLAVLLYQQTHSDEDLALARKFLSWGQGALFAPGQGLYVDSTVNATPVDYIEGPLTYAQALLCRLTSTPSECQTAQSLKVASLKRFGYELDFSPQYDAIYLQWMLALYSLEGDPSLYAMAAENARRAVAHAVNAEGLYLLSWSGETLPAIDAEPGMLQTQASTVSLFAWLAVYPPPA